MKALRAANDLKTDSIKVGQEIEDSGESRGTRGGTGPDVGSAGRTDDTGRSGFARTFESGRAGPLSWFNSGRRVTSPRRPDA